VGKTHPRAGCRKPEAFKYVELCEYIQNIVKLFRAFEDIQRFSILSETIQRIVIQSIKSV